MKSKKKLILDACCGPKHFWFNKNHPYVIYMDIRKRKKGFFKYRKNVEINPDIVADFRHIPFPDKTFKLVVFDPPHLLGKSKINIAKEYGFLNKKTWKKDIKQGFDECWRVLDDYGVLIFKWSETSIKRKEILEVIGKEPLFGHTIRSRVKTHWFCFMKIPEE